MQLIRLVYASVAQPGLDYAALTAILRRSEERNAEDRITGLLCYGNGTFLQALEGERGLVNRTYSRIMADRRHSHCEILEYGAIPSRSFSEWSMKLIGLDDEVTGRRRSLVLQHCTTPVFQPFKMSGRQACDFLEDLAALERRVA